MSESNERGAPAEAQERDLDMLRELWQYAYSGNAAARVKDPKNIYEKHIYDCIQAAKRVESHCRAALSGSKG